MDSQRFNKCMSKPFRGYKEERSLFSTQVITILLRQIKVYEENGIPYSTPEEWDKGTSILGSSPSFRYSKSILAKTDWKNFLKIISENKD